MTLSCATSTNRRRCRHGFNAPTHPPTHGQSEHGGCQHTGDGHVCTEQRYRKQQGVQTQLRCGDEKGDARRTGHTALDQRSVDRQDAAAADRQRQAKDHSAPGLT